jgi:hypothetical protein
VGRIYIRKTVGLRTHRQGAMLLFGLLTACARTPLPTAAPSSRAAKSPACPLEIVAAPPTLTFADTRQALHDFDQSPDTAYCVLYIRQVAGFLGSNRCVLVRQRAANRFLVYKYGTQRIYSGQMTDSTWRLALAQLAATPGHLMSLCGLTTDPSSEFLVVKHQGKIVFSLAWETYRLDRLPIGQEARLAPALALMRRFRF